MTRGFKLSLLALAVLSSSFIVHAQEVVSPLQPGATAGSHTGALPPEGVYFGYDIDHEWGKFDKLGQPTKIEASNQSMVASLIWSTPYQVLGARYAMGIAQPYKFASTKVGGMKQPDVNGLMNTQLMPAILSWDLGSGLFVGAGLTIGLPNGRHSYATDPSGQSVRGGKTLSNGYWVVRPNVALTYFNGDYGFTMNHSVDFNAPNKDTHYRTGNTYYLDLTATKRINKWTVGLIGNWTKQLRDDKVNGETVPNFYNGGGITTETAGNRLEHVMVGPMLAYDFGKFSVNTRLLASVRSKNDPKMRFWHVGVSVPLK